MISVFVEPDKSVIESMTAYVKFIRVDILNFSGQSEEKNSVLKQQLETQIFSTSLERMYDLTETNKFLKLLARLENSLIMLIKTWNKLKQDKNIRKF